jgi:hypothetical protein
MSGSAVLAWLESTSLHDWVLGSTFAFPVILTLHAIGMGFAAGLGAMLDLRILGVARTVPIAELRRFLPVLWIGFWVNVASGLLLLVGYPTKALTNPVFYLKLAFVAGGMFLLIRIKRRVFDAAIAGETSERSPSVRRLATISLVCWAGAITAGRLLAYTYRHLNVSDY